MGISSSSGKILFSTFRYNIDSTVGPCFHLGNYIIKNCNILDNESNGTNGYYLLHTDSSLILINCAIDGNIRKRGLFNVNTISIYDSFISTNINNVITIVNTVLSTSYNSLSHINTEECYAFIAYCKPEKRDKCSCHNLFKLIGSLKSFSINII